MFEKKKYSNHINIMLTLKSQLRVPTTGKIVFDDNAALQYVNDTESFEFQIGDETVTISKDVTTTAVDIETVKEVPISTNTGESDDGTLRVMLAADLTPAGSSAVNTNLKTLNGFTVDLFTGATNTGTQRMVLSNDYKSTCTTIGPTYTIFNTPLKYVDILDAADDYSGADTNFIYTATADNTYVTRMLVYYEDNDVFFPDGYGPSPALTNGIFIYWNIDSVETIFNEDLPIKTNGLWNTICHDNQYLDYGSSNEALKIQISFKDRISPSGLLLNTGDSFGVRLHDNFAFLVHQYFTIQGYVLS